MPEPGAVRDDERFSRLKAEISKRSGPAGNSARVDWERVVSLGSNLLGDKGADLLICAWLAAGLARIGGLSGLKAGSALMAQTCALFWDSLSPSERRLGSKLAIIEWWVRESGECLAETVGADAPGGPYSAIIGSLEKLESFLDRAAPGWDPRLWELRLALEELRRRRRLLIVRIFCWIIGAALAILLLFPGIVAEKPDPPLDELYAYGPCGLSGPWGSGVVGDWGGDYDSLGRFVAKIHFKGAVGAVKVASELDGPNPVTYIDIGGDYVLPGSASKPRSGGAVDFMRLGRHKGFTRLSVNYGSGAPPDLVRTEAKCLRDSSGREILALRLAFGPGGR